MRPPSFFLTCACACTISGTFGYHRILFAGSSCFEPAVSTTTWGDKRKSDFVLSQWKNGRYQNGWDNEWSEFWRGDCYARGQCWKQASWVSGAFISGEVQLTRPTYYPRKSMCKLIALQDTRTVNISKPNEERGVCWYSKGSTHFPCFFHAVIDNKLCVFSSCLTTHCRSMEIRKKWYHARSSWMSTMTESMLWVNIWRMSSKNCSTLRFVWQNFNCKECNLRVLYLLGYDPLKLAESWYVYIPLTASSLQDLLNARRREITTENHMKQIGKLLSLGPMSFCTTL